MRSEILCSASRPRVCIFILTAISLMLDTIFNILTPACSVSHRGQIQLLTTNPGAGYVKKRSRVGSILSKPMSESQKFVMTHWNLLL